MSTPFNLFRRQILLLLTLVAYGLSLLVVAVPQHAGAASTGCPNNGGNFCYKLTVKLTNAPSGTVVVEAVRQKDTNLDDTRFTLDRVSATEYTSTNTVYGTDATFDPCILTAGSPDAAAQLFDIAVRSNGQLLGSLTSVNLCQNARDGRVTTDNNTRVKTVTVDIASPTDTNANGGITGKVTYLDTELNPPNGVRKNCEPNTVVDITDPSGKVVRTTIDANGRFNTGLTLPPGTYTVYVSCGRGVDLFKTVTVRANNITDIGELNETNTEKDPAAAVDKAPPPTCEDYGGGMSWVICPIMDMIDGAISAFIDGIENLLTLDRLYGNTSGGLYKVWGAVRNIALLILVPMMLLMVIGTAIDMGPFDAYTVKKALPRMLFAVMFILLSWSICTFFIDMSDAIGVGIKNFIENVGANGPLSLDAVLNKALGGSTVKQSGLFVGSLLAIGATTALGIVSFGIIGSLALSAFVGFLLGYLVLIFRQLMILGLLLASPLAILVWIFPGNDKLWTFWKTGFIGLLAVFPVVAALIGMGRVAAFIVAGL